MITILGYGNDAANLLSFLSPRDADEQPVVIKLLMTQICIRQPDRLLPMDTDGFPTLSLPWRRVRWTDLLRRFRGQISKGMLIFHRQKGGDSDLAVNFCHFRFRICVCGAVMIG